MNTTNPDGLPPPDPGYRYLCEGETLKKSDEFKYRGLWRKTEEAGGVVGSPHLLATYRRAINVDDPSAPPPAEWVKPGYTVAKGPLPTGLRSNVEGWFNKWLSACEGNSFCLYYRYPTITTNPNPIDPNAMNPSSLPNPLTVKDGQSIIVKVGNSQALSRAAQEIAFEAGWRWTLSGKEFKEKAVETYKEATCLGLDSEKGLTYRDSPLDFPGKTVVLDARTDLGKLIDLLAEANKPKLPPVPALDGPDDKSYEAVYVKGQSVVSFGCAKIDIGLLEDAALLLNGVTPNKVNGAISSNRARASYIGNRNVKSITLDSGAVINGGEAKEILEYVYAVNKEPQ